MDRHSIGKTVFASLLVLLLSACGGGGSAVSDVAPEPAPPGTPAVAPLPIQADPSPEFSAAEGIVATITSATIDSPPVVDFTVTDEEGVAITDLTSSNVRFTIAKLIPGTNGSASAWQSYINREKVPTINPDNAPVVQATFENGGDLSNHLDGTYTYTFVTDIKNVTDPLTVSFEPEMTHRVGMQFSGGPPVLNPTFDWLPINGATSGILTRNIVAIESCNTCHDPLAMHGGGRRDTKYCVTCHNPGTTEPDSQNTVDFKVMIHKIHRGVNLPSVVAGGEYVIYGFQSSRNDFSNVLYPQDIRNCTNCHAGARTGSNNALVTADGDSWSEVPTRAACGSCHDDVDFTSHNGGQPTDANCASCHRDLGAAGSVVESHRVLTQEGNRQFKVNILSVTNTAPGEFPIINLSVVNPESNDAPYDILSDPEWSGARMSAGLAWSTSDYTNTGNGSVNASMVSTDVLAKAVGNDDGTFTVVSDHAIPDGSVAPGIAASGSGTIVIESRASLSLAGESVSVPVDFAISSFSIDEPDGVTSERRQVVDIQKCNVCHKLKTNHGNNRTNDTQGCIGCHNPRNTDRSARAIAADPPTDNKQEESLDFKRLIHAIHASNFRKDPLQVVGFGGFSTHVFSVDEVAFPGRLSNCNTCHVNDSYRLPLSADVLASTIDTGDDRHDSADDLMITPTASVCSSCHDKSQFHMELNGADFTATETTIRSGASTESCPACHGPGGIVDVEAVHDLE